MRAKVVYLCRRLSRRHTAQADSEPGGILYCIEGGWWDTSRDIHFRISIVKSNSLGSYLTTACTTVLTVACSFSNAIFTDNWLVRSCREFAWTFFHSDQVGWWKARLPQHLEDHPQPCISHARVAADRYTCKVPEPPNICSMIHSRTNLLRG